MLKTLILLLLIILQSARLIAQVDSVTIEINDSIKLIMERVKFDTIEKKYEYYDNKFPFSINGRPIFGSDGEIPKYTLAKATLIIGTNKYALQVDNMYNPWFGKPNDKVFTIKKNGIEFRLRGLFSDGAGTYGAEWLIIGQSCIRTILTQDEWIMFEYFDDKKQ